MYVKISAVVPVYNTCGYLRLCLDSILQQTYSAMEIILINDGSADGSGEICDAYAQKDCRVRVIHQENKGVAEARKQGIKAATGEYIAFIDSDDYIEPDMFEKLGELATMTSADIVTSGYVREYSQKGTKKRAVGAIVHDGFPEGFYGIEEKGFVCKNLMYMEGYSKQGICPLLCSKIVKKNLLEDNVDRVPKKLTYVEDSCLIYLCCMDAESIYVSHDAFYHYYMRETSCTHTPDKKCFGVLDACYHCLSQKIMTMREYGEELNFQMEKFIAVIALRCLNNRFGFSKGGLLPLYTVPLKGLDAGTKLILYGAGMVGRSCYQQITAMGQADIVLWVDNDDSVVKNNALLKPVSAIQESEFDFVLIAVKNEGMADMIRSDLQKLGVKKEKIIWKKPQHILDIFACLNDKW